MVYDPFGAHYAPAAPPPPIPEPFRYYVPNTTPLPGSYGMTDRFGGLSGAGQDFITQNPTVGYQHVADALARPGSAYHQYFLQQYSRLHNAFDYQSIQYPNRTWGDYLNQNAPGVATDYANQTARQRGEDPGMWAWQGGRWQ